MPQQREHPAQGWGQLPTVTTLPPKWKKGVLARWFATKSILTPLPTSIIEGIYSCRKNANLGWIFLSRLNVFLWRVLQSGQKKFLDRNTLTETYPVKSYAVSGGNFHLTDWLVTWPSFTAAVNTSSLEFLRDLQLAGSTIGALPDSRFVASQWQDAVATCSMYFHLPLLSKCSKNVTWDGYFCLSASLVAAKVFSFTLCVVEWRPWLT